MTAHGNEVADLGGDAPVLIDGVGGPAAHAARVGHTVNGECDNSEIYLDENNNNEFDADGLADGQGYTRDAVSYTVTAKYDRIMPLAGMLGWSNKVELSAATTIANQPYGQRGEILSRKCDA